MRLIAWTGGAMALLLVMAGNAFAYLHVDNARLGGAGTTQDVQKIIVQSRGYNPAAVHFATPGSCFNSFWQGQWSNQGCWKRVNDNWVTMQFGFLYFGSRPSGVYEVRATGDDSCFRVVKQDLATITYPNGEVYSVPFFERYVGCSAAEFAARGFA